MQRKSFVLVSSFVLLLLSSCGPYPSLSVTSVSSSSSLETPVVSSSTPVSSSNGETTSQGPREALDVEIREDTLKQGVGRVRLSTLPVPANMSIVIATYTMSGQIMAYYRDTAVDGSPYRMAMFNPDFTSFRILYEGGISGGLRLMGDYADDKMLLGDYLLEAPEGTTFANCPRLSATLYPVKYPSAYLPANDPQITNKWSEIVLSNDGKTIAWTSLRKDVGSAVLVGSLVKNGSAYEIQNAHYVSSSASFSQDPEKEGYLLPKTLVGGETKQFVQGGKALSCVSAAPNGMGDSCYFDLETGDVTRQTRAPGYDETTISSPDEKFGLTMTTRFSKTTDFGAVGLLPRPFGAAAMGMMSQIYVYSVSGVRRGRKGNIGPALINLERSKTEDDYQGMDLSDQSGTYVYNSPMSWSGDGKNGLWPESSLSGGKTRWRHVELLDYTPTEPIKPVAVPMTSSYAEKTPTSRNISGKVAGKIAGEATINQLSSNDISVVYSAFKDEANRVYEGSETYQGSLSAGSTYTAEVTLKDDEGNLLGSLSAKIVFKSMARLDVAQSYARASYLNRSLDLSSCVE